jgi:hypothetical protein
MNRSSPLINRQGSPEAKIAMLRSLFRGRDDVNARRFENLRTGKSGFSPACANEFVHGATAPFAPPNEVSSRSVGRVARLRLKTKPSLQTPVPVNRVIH